MPKLRRHLDEALLAIALMYQRPGVSPQKRTVARRYLRWRARPIVQRARAVGVRIAVAAAVAVLVSVAATWYRRRIARRAGALPVDAEPHPNGAGVSPLVAVPPDPQR